MAAIMCTSGQVKLNAGTDVSTALTFQNYEDLIKQAEAYVNTVTRHNYTDDYTSGINDDVSGILQMATSSYAALGAINFDLAGYSSANANIMLNLNYAKLNDAMKLLGAEEYRDFIDNA